MCLFFQPNHIHFLDLKEPKNERGRFWFYLHIRFPHRFPRSPGKIRQPLVWGVWGLLCDWGGGGIFSHVDPLQVPASEAPPEGAGAERSWRSEQFLCVFLAGVLQKTARKHPTTASVDSDYLGFWRLERKEVFCSADGLCCGLACFGVWDLWGGAKSKVLLTGWQSGEVVSFQSYSFGCGGPSTHVAPSLSRAQ